MITINKKKLNEQRVEVLNELATLKPLVEEHKETAGKIWNAIFKMYNNLSLEDMDIITYDKREKELEKYLNKAHDLKHKSAQYLRDFVRYLEFEVEEFDFSEFDRWYGRINTCGSMERSLREKRCQEMIDGFNAWLQKRWDFINKVHQYLNENPVHYDPSIFGEEEEAEPVQITAAPEESTEEPKEPKIYVVKRSEILEMGECYEDIPPEQLQIIEDVPDYKNPYEQVKESEVEETKVEEQKVEATVEEPTVQPKKETVEDKKAAFLARMAKNKVLQARKDPVKKETEDKKVTFFAHMKTFLTSTVNTVKNVIVSVAKKATQEAIKLKNQFFAKMKSFLVPKTV